MPAFWDNITDSDAYKGLVGLGRTSYDFVMGHVWPVYSTGVAVGFMFLLAAMHEKQTIADTQFGDGRLAKDPEECAGLMKHASELLEEEVNQSVKSDVYALSHAELKAEHAAKQF